MLLNKAFTCLFSYTEHIALGTVSPIYLFIVQDIAEVIFFYVI